MSNHSFKPLACGFHSHAHLSLDGGSTAKSKILHASNIGRVADCLTDHGIMSGIAEHWMAKEALIKKGKIDSNFKCIHGIEAYVIDPHRPAKVQKNGKIIPQYYHLTLHFKNQDAYFYFCKLSKQMEDRAVIKFGERKPLMTFQELESIAGEITIGSGCVMGPVQKNILTGRPALAKEMYEYLRNLAGEGNFYVEVFPHIVDHNWVSPKFEKTTKKEISKGYFDPILKPRDWEGPEDTLPEVDPCTCRLDIQKAPNQFVIEMAKKYGDPIVISLDDHYGPKEDRLVQESRLGNGQERWKFYGCLQENTMVRMADWTNKKISEIQPGDSVISYDIENRRMTTSRVNKVMVKDSNIKEYYSFSLPSKYKVPKILHATPNHYIWTDQGWNQIGDADHFYTLRKEFTDEDITLVKAGISREGWKSYKPWGGERKIPAKSKCISFAKKYDLEIENTACFFANDVLVHNSYHAMTSEEAADSLTEQLGVPKKDIESWVDNSYQFIEHFDNYKFPDAKDQILLPSVEMIYGIQEAKKTTIEIFREKASKHNLLPKKDDPKYQEYMDRIEYELGILTKNDSGEDFMPYFFLLEDVCSFARENDILNTSRGSCGGSLVAYAMRIVITDPIKYDLPFERFLNPGRIKGGSWPDVDLDWENRLLILDYIRKKYGDCVALIASDGKMRLKSSIQDAERALRGSLSEDTAKMTKSIRIPIGEDDEKWLFGTDEKEAFFEDKENPVAEELRYYADKNPDIWNMVKRCLGVTRQRGIHAGGIVIAPGPINNFFPVIKQSKTDAYVTAYDMVGVEYSGGIKYDMLGIKTLDALGTAIRSIKKVENVDIDWGEFPEDNDVYEAIIKKGLLEGVFQLNTNVAKPLVEAIQPKNAIEIAIVTALGRPGCLNSDSPDPNHNGTSAQFFIECATGVREPYYIHPDIKEIFKPTYGIPVFQEQLMAVGGICAGYSLSEADTIIRKGIGKKDAAKIAQFAKDLQERLPGRGWSENQISQLINLVKAAANYSFNRSHAVSYGIVAWNCAWLKYYYPSHYWKGMLTAFADKPEKVTGFLDECRWRIRPVDILKSHPTEWNIEGKEYIRMPLSMIKGCGSKGTIALRKFVDTPLGEL